MNWEPISKYDELKVKPEFCAFYFEATKPKRNEHRGNALRETVQLNRVYGNRKCTLFLVLPAPVAKDEQLND